MRLVADRVDMPALVEEFAATSLEEIDYLHEAANAERFAADFADDPRVSVPEVVWERTTRRVLTLQDVTAIKINDVDALRAAGIDPSEVAAEFAAVMFDQLFVDGFFHADPHPGNIFVTPGARTGGADAAPRDWHFTFIDFGMMGEVPDGLRSGLRRVLIAAASRDGKGMVDGIRERRRAAALRRHRRARARDDEAVRPLRRHGLRRAAGGRPARVPRVRDSSSATSCARCRSSCRRTSC